MSCALMTAHTPCGRSECWQTKDMQSVKQERVGAHAKASYKYAKSANVFLRKRGLKYALCAAQGLRVEMSSPSAVHVTEPEMDSGAHFVELCAQRGIPLLFLQNIMVRMLPATCVSHVCCLLACAPCLPSCSASVLPAENPKS